MSLSLLTDLVFCPEHILLLLFIIGFFMFQALFAWLKSVLGSHRTRSSREMGVREESVALVPKANSARSASTSAKAQSVNVLMCLLPEDLCGRVACYCGFQGVGTLSASCKKLQLQVWESREVWMALAATAKLATSFVARCSGREACDVFRRGFFRTDLSRLRSLSSSGRSQPILEEAAHVACGLLPGDLSDSEMTDFVQIGSRSLGAHDPESPAANRAAERLLRASRRCIALFTEEQLEHLEYAYKSVHQIHALMLSSMKDSYEGMLEQSMWTGPPDPDMADDPYFKEFMELCNEPISAMNAE